MIKMAYTAIPFATLIALASTPGSAADKELLDTLLSNGAINRDQYEKLLKKEEVTEESLEEVDVSLGKKGLVLKTKDGDFDMTIGGRLHADATFHSGDPVGGEEATDGTEIRRARISMNGSLYRDWIWNAEADFADNNVEVKDFFVGYRGFEGLTAFTGHLKQPYSLAVEMSSNDIPFIERSIDNDLVIPFIDRAIGLRLESFGNDWFFAGGLYGDGVAPNKEDDEGWGSAVRYVVAPIHNENTVIHLGGRGAYRVPSDDGRSVRMRDETTRMSNLRIVDTGEITEIDNVVLAGGEASAVYGPFSVTGEFNHAFISRDIGPDLDFDSWHVEATFSLTGETRAASYKMAGGEFKRLKPSRNFSLANGGWGAFELAGRIAYIDLNDQDILGGRETAITGALNWYFNENVRFLVDYTRVYDTDDSSLLRLDAEDLNIVQLRTQVSF